MAGFEQQRRDAFRVGVNRSVLVRRGDEEFPGQLRDLSISGARLLSDPELVVDDAITIELDIDGDDLVLPGHVVRADDLGAGIRFDALKPAQEARIARFVFDQQRRRVRPRD